MSKQIPRWQLIVYSSGSLATAVSYQAFSTYVQFLYIDVYGLRAAWVGLIWSIYGLWNAVNDPLAGFLSDRTHTRWGRRIPWIAGSFIPLSITFYLLFVPPAGMVATPDLSLLFYFLFFVLAFDLLWTIAVMNWIPTVLVAKMFRLSLTPNVQFHHYAAALAVLVSTILLLLGLEVWLVRRQDQR